MSETVRLEKWIVVTDGGQYTVSTREKDAILKADRAGARFVHLEKVVINIAFVKEIYRKRETKDLKFSSLSPVDKKYLIPAGEDPLQLK